MWIWDMQMSETAWRDYGGKGRGNRELFMWLNQETSFMISLRWCWMMGSMTNNYRVDWNFWNLRFGSACILQLLLAFSAHIPSQNALEKATEKAGLGFPPLPLMVILFLLTSFLGKRHRAAVVIPWSVSRPFPGALISKGDNVPMGGKGSAFFILPVDVFLSVSPNLETSWKRSESCTSNIKCIMYS